MLRVKVNFLPPVDISSTYLIFLYMSGIFCILCSRPVSHKLSMVFYKISVSFHPEPAEPLLISPWSPQVHLHPAHTTGQLTVLPRPLPSSPPTQKARQWWAGLRGLLVKDTWGGGVRLEGSHSRAQRGMLGIILQPTLPTTSCKRRSIEGKRLAQGNTATWQERAWRLPHRLRLTDRGLGTAK